MSKCTIQFLTQIDLKQQIIVVAKKHISTCRNSRALIGLAIMVYEPIYHALQIR